MMRALVILSASLTCGCTIHVGAALHAESHDAPEVQGLDNPLGVVRVSAPGERTEWFCEHISAFRVTEQGYGFNVCGVLVPVR